MARTVAAAFDRRTRRLVAASSDGLPSISVWLGRIAAIGHPALTEAIEGIWAGRSGEVRLEMPGWRSWLVMGWHSGRVEWAYLS